MKLKYTGQVAKVFHDIGELIPDEVRDYPHEVAKRLLAQGEFEVVQAVSRARKVARKLEVDKSTGKNA